MAQTGFTPIQLYSSSTATNVPLAANLATGELAINITDGKLFYKDNANAVQVIGWKVVPATAGGTGQTSYAVGDLLYADTTTTLAKLADVATGNALISGGVGVAPSWGKIGLTTHISGTLGVGNGGTGQSSNLTQYGVVYGSTTTAMATTAAGTSTQVLHGNASGAPTWSAVSLTADVSGTLPVANGGTNLTSFTANGLVYASSTSALTTNAGLTFNGTDFAVGVLNDNTARTFSVYNNAGGEGTLFGTFVRSNGGSNSLRVLNVLDYFANAADSACQMGRNSTNLRSLNAGGTINASGADYAEYMTKSGDFTIAKGDVVGIDAQGKLTNLFADAVSFVVKSTDPSYVGGDTWGNEESLGLKLLTNESTQEEKDAFKAAVETARQQVDRIAFAGQVPVNVTGATAGQYIIPVNDNGAIKGEAISNPTFEQYKIAVGKVIAIESDGRARIIVKVI
jgi:hypothetical protein